jgi:hypothetical protein
MKSAKKNCQPQLYEQASENFMIAALPLKPQELSFRTPVFSENIAKLNRFIETDLKNKICYPKNF